MNTTQNIQVNIPPEIQEKIDAEEYTRNGNVVRDKKGRIICNLESLDIDDDHFFSPSIFVSFQSLAITSVSTVSTRLQNELAELRTSYASFDLKIDSVLDNQTNTIIALIAEFEEHFRSLIEKSTLTDEKKAFSAGIAAATQLAGSIQSYIRGYLGSTIVFYEKGKYEGETYSTYLAENKNNKYAPTITRTKFQNFGASNAYFFTYSFINVINNINILSLCYDSKIYPRYEVSLQQIRSEMVEILSKLINGLEREGDIYDMCYSTNEFKEFYPIDKEILDKLLAYSRGDINQLICRNYGSQRRDKFDDNRFSSMQTVIRIIDDIDNLLERKEQFIGLDLKELPELEQIKKLTFGN
ncbi:hypothetical protein ACO0K2_12995 [Undibacterium sp. MH2W]|uniref:hypothetical protein n=1 Tax=Undibacterium sp. MH2W TaxID=3413044 RepID=UPI003BF38283